MAVTLGTNIALPLSSAYSYRLAFDQMGKIANYGKLGVTMLPIPSEFGSTPFGISVYADGTTDFAPTSYRLTEGDSGVTTYYVDKATGSDSNLGTSASPFKTVFKAISTGRGEAPNVLVKAKGGNYYLTEGMSEKAAEAVNLSIVSWDGNPVCLTHENPNIVPASWTLDSDNTYWASTAGYGYSDYASSAWDGSTPNAYGDHSPLIPAASIAACKSTANTYFTDQPTHRIYVHCSDNRAPDANIHIYDAWSTPGQYRDYAGAPAIAQCYFENVHFLGGNGSFYLFQSHATNITTAVFNNCVFKYGGGALSGSAYCIGNVRVAMVNCIAASNHKDNFSYLAYGGNPPPQAIEIGCTSRYAGAILSGAANQGSSMHDGGKIVRAAGNYHHNENDQVADVGSGTNVWMVACNASNGLKSNYAAYLCGNGGGATHAWLYNCAAVSCTKDIYIGAGSTVTDEAHPARAVIDNSAGTYVSI